MDKNELLEQIGILKRSYGDWGYNIPLSFGIRTNENPDIPHTRLKRIVQIVNDLVDKPLSKCRILDLGCLDGMFAIEFAQHGAETIGVEIREANIKKAIFCKEVLNLNNLEFRQDDARNISIESYGMFDAIICSGLLYHLTASDAIELITKMFDMSRKIVIIDTHIALKPKIVFKKGTDAYWGVLFREHGQNDSQDIKSNRIWSSYDNDKSFWFTRPSLINILNKTGFTSVYECFTPIHLNFGKPGIQSIDRCTFVAVKSKQCDLVTSPLANHLYEKWPEKSLEYSTTKMKAAKIFLNKIMAKFKKLINLK